MVAPIKPSERKLGVQVSGLLKAGTQLADDENVLLGVSLIVCTDAGPAFWDDWAQRIAKLEGQIEEAREANVSVNRAKRLVKDMQAQAAAAEAAARLEEVLQHKPCGSGLLKVTSE